MTDQEAIAAAMPGDWVKAKYRGHPFEGEVWTEGSSGLLVGASYLRLRAGDSPPRITDVTVTRAAWPTGTVLAWFGPTFEHLGIVERTGSVLCRDGIHKQSAIRVFSPTILRLGGAK